jgi:hypothetical protein
MIFIHMDIATTYSHWSLKTSLPIYVAKSIGEYYQRIFYGYVCQEYTCLTDGFAHRITDKIYIGDSIGLYIETINNSM